jgi:hypothetical protein
MIDAVVSVHLPVRDRRTPAEILGHHERDLPR